MKLLILFLLISSGLAKEPLHWAHIIDVSDKHEFYKSGEIISRPRDAWQSLFSLVYVDRNLSTIKDCLFYLVPGELPGVVKIKTIYVEEKCDDYLLKPGDKEIRNLSSLQFSFSLEKLKLTFSGADFKTQTWEAIIHSLKSSSSAQQNLSSAEFKGPKLIYLAPVILPKKEKNKIVLKDNSLCHDINDDCQEVTPSSCGRCKSSWYETPNGCPIGPKFCGIHVCGEKGRPACRRGMKWQRKESDYDCRTDSTFAYCRKGLRIECEGRKAYCR